MSGARRQMDLLNFDYRRFDPELSSPEYVQPPSINEMAITERQVFISHRKNSLTHIDGNNINQNSYEKQIIPSDRRYERDNDPLIGLSSESDRDLRFLIQQRKEQEMLEAELEKSAYIYDKEAQKSMYYNQGRLCNFTSSLQGHGSNYQIEHMSDLRERPAKMSFIENNSRTPLIMENRLGLQPMEYPKTNIEKYAIPRSEQQLSGSVQNSLVGQLSQTELSNFVKQSTFVGCRPNHPGGYLGQNPSTVNMGQLSFHESEQSGQVNLGVSGYRRSRCDQMYANEPNRSTSAIDSSSMLLNAYNSLRESPNFRSRTIPSNSTDQHVADDSKRTFMNNSHERFSGEGLKRPREGECDWHSENPYNDYKVYRNQIRKDDRYQIIISDNREMESPKIWPENTKEKSVGLIYPRIREKRDHSGNSQDCYSNTERHEQRNSNDVITREFEVWEQSEQSRAHNSRSCMRENDLRYNIDFIRKRNRSKEKNRNWNLSARADLSDEFRIAPENRDSSSRQQSHRFNSGENLNHDQRESDNFKQKRNYSPPSDFMERGRPRHISRDREQSPRFETFLRAFTDEKNPRYSKEMEKCNFDEYWKKEYPNEPESESSMNRSKRPEGSMFRSRSRERTMFRSRSPERSMVRSRSPERSTYRSRSPERSTFRSRSPERSTFRLRSPERGRFFNPDPFDQECNWMNKKEMYESQHYSKEGSPSNFVNTSKGISRQPKASRNPEQDGQLNGSNPNLGQPIPPVQPVKIKKPKVRVHWKDLSDEAIMKLRKNMDKPKNPVVINYGNLVRAKEEEDEDGIEIINLTEDERRVKVVFLDCSQPQLTLTQFRAEKLQNFLHKMVRLNPIEPGLHPKFLNVHYTDNSLVLECNNMATYNWLRQQLQNSVSRPWKKAQLKVIPKFKFVTGKMIIPCDEMATVNSIFEIIKRYNPGLYPERWRIFYRTRSKGQVGCYFIVGIEQESYDKIIADNCNILYGKQVLKIEFPHLTPSKTNLAAHNTKPCT